MPRASEDPKEIRVKAAHGASEESLARRAGMALQASQERGVWLALRGSRACQVSPVCWAARAIRESQGHQDLRVLLAPRGARVHLG